MHHVSQFLDASLYWYQTRLHVSPQVQGCAQILLLAVRSGHTCLFSTMLRQKATPYSVAPLRINEESQSFLRAPASYIQYDLAQGTYAHLIPYHFTNLFAVFLVPTSP